MTQKVVHRALDGVADYVFPPACFVVRFSPRQFQKLGQEDLGEAMAPNGLFTQLVAALGQTDSVFRGDQALSFETLHHLADSRTGNLQTVSDPCLDDTDVVFAKLEDALAIFFEGWVMLTGRRHDATLPECRRRLCGCPTLCCRSGSDGS